jgi:acetyl esterase/lipase
MGASAGAHLAALSVLAAPEQVTGYVGLFGRYDLTAAGAVTRPASHLEIPDVVRLSTPPPGYEGIDQRGKLALLAGVGRDDLSEQVLGGISPIEQVNDGVPPVLLLHGTGDAIVHHSHSLRFAEALVTAGTREEVSVMLVPGANHEDPVFADSACVDVISSFVFRCTARVVARTHS